MAPRNRTQSGYRLTEIRWELEWSSQRRLLASADNYQLDLSTCTWIDLLPLLHLAKLLLQRSASHGTATEIRLPVTRERNKVLAFLLETGFVPLLSERGVRFVANLHGQHVDIPPFSVTGLAEPRFLAQMEQLGYRPRAQSDRLLLPITIIDAHGQVESLRAALWSYLDLPVMRYYKAALGDGALIDSFFRELTENAVEHGAGATALVAMRLLRSPYDAARNSDRVASERIEGKLPPLQRLLERHPYDALIELVVLDTGPGIRGTVEEAVAEGAEQRQLVAGPLGHYRWAFRPYTSRISTTERVSRGKSELTGLGACSFCLRALPAVVSVREGPSYTGIFPEAFSLPRDGDAAEAAAPVPPTIREGGLLFEDLESLLPRSRQGAVLDTVVGCNIQVAIALPQRLAGRRRLPFRAARHPTVDRRAGDQELRLAFHHADPAAWSRPRSTLLRRKVAAGSEPVAGHLVDVSNVPSHKDAADRLLKSLLKLQKQAPTALVGATLSLMWRLRHALDSRRAPPTLILNLSSLLEVALVSNRPDIEEPLVSWIYRRLRPSSLTQESTALAFRSIPLLEESHQQRRDFLWTLAQSWLQALRKHLSGSIRERFVRRMGEGRAVRLPNQALVAGYIDVAAILADPVVTTQLTTALALIVGIEEIDVIVTFSAVGRLMVSRLLDQFPGLVKELPLLDPYSAELDHQPVGLGKGARLAVLGDISHTGGHLARIERLLAFSGLPAACVVAPFHTTELPIRVHSNLPCYALCEVPLPELHGVEAAEVIDPFTLDLLPERSSREASEPRSEALRQATYNDLRHAKALVVGHFTNTAGRHFALGVDFRLLLAPPYRRYLLSKLAQHLAGVRIVIVPERSEVANAHLEVVEEGLLGDLLVVPAIPAPASRHGIRFRSGHFEELEAAAASGEVVAILDDAMGHQRVLSLIATRLLELGIRRIRFCVLLDNSPPARTTPLRLAGAGTTEGEIETVFLYRTFFPVAESASGCPLCRLASSLEAGASASANAFIKRLLMDMQAAAAAINLRELSLEPTRCASELVSVPWHENLPFGLPTRYPTVEQFVLAAMEASWRQASLPWILEGLKTLRGRALEALLMVCGTLVSRFRRANLVDRYVDRVVAVLDNGEEREMLGALRAVLMWPAEIIAERLDLLTRNPRLYGSPAAMALLAALIHKAKADADTSFEELADQQPGSLPWLFSLRGIQRSLSTRIPEPDLEAIFRLLLAINPHRSIHHTHEKELRDLTQVSSVETAAGFFALQHDERAKRGDRVHRAGLLLALGEVAQGLRTLRDKSELRGEIDASGLLPAIEVVLDVAARAGHARLQDGELWAVLLEKIPVLELLRRSESEPGIRFAGLSRKLIGNVQQLEQHLLGPLEEALDTIKLERQPGQSLRLPSSPEKKASYGVFLFCNSEVVSRLVMSLSSNMKAALSPSGQRAIGGAVRVSAVTGTDGALQLEFRNACEGRVAEDNLRSGRDYLSLKAQLIRFGADFVADFDPETNDLVSRISFQVV